MTVPGAPDGTTGVRRSRAMATLVVVVALLTGLVAGMATDRHFAPRWRGPFGGHFAGRGPHAWGGGPGGGPPGGMDGGRGGPPGPSDRMRQRFASELGLTPAQMAQVDSIMTRSMTARRAIEDSIRPRMRTILDSTRSQIERVLTPDQRQKFEAWRSRSRAP